MFFDPAKEEATVEDPKIEEATPEAEAEEATTGDE